MNELRGAALLAATLLLAGAGLALGPGCAATPDEQKEESLGDLRDYLTDDVAPERSGNALAILDRIDAQAERLVKLRDEFQRDLARLNTDYATTDEALLARASEYRQARAAARHEVIEARSAMREALAPTEWAGYAEREGRLFAAVARKGDQ